jgi:serine/threonine protein phosphatase PrpC
MGTTGVLCLMAQEDERDMAVVGWVGDSRAYLMRNGKIEILTLDDAGWLVHVPEDARARQQHIQATAESVKDMPDDANPRRIVRDPSITQYLGQMSYVYPKNATARQLLGAWSPTKSEIDIHIVTKELQPDDIFILSSDGLTDVLTLQQIEQILTGNHPEEATQLLYNKTLLTNINHEPRAKDDDITIQILKFTK